MTDYGPPLRERCLHRWPNLLPLVGIDQKFLSSRHGPCPMCGGKDRFRFDDKNGAGTWICNQCGAGDGIALVEKVTGKDFRGVAELLEAQIGAAAPTVTRRERSAERQREAMNWLWNGSFPVGHFDPVGQYLANRGIKPASYPAVLRYAERCRYHEEGADPRWFPAMVAKVTAPDGNPATIHRTYLTEGGRKAPVDTVRKLMAGKYPIGGAVRLAPSHGPVLGIAEGIETAMSASSIFAIPCWAATNATMLGQWDPPPHVEEVVIFADNDPSFTGHQVAYSLARTLVTGPRKLKARVEMPPDAGMDWNDVLMAEQQAAA
jgi:putative DNA primase/helicase